MSKVKSGFYLELSRHIFPQKNMVSISYKEVSPMSRWIYCCLVELEHRYTVGKTKRNLNRPLNDFFFHSNKDLAELAGVSQRTVQKARTELMEAGLVKSWQMHWQDSKTGKLSYKHVSAYRMTHQQSARFTFCAMQKLPIGSRQNFPFLYKRQMFYLKDGSLTKIYQVAYSD